MLRNRAAFVSHAYDRSMYLPVQNALYGESDFCNFGYWDEDTREPHEACENLQARLLSFFPDFHGRVLDVACGKGATTRHLLRHFPACRVAGINISRKQLATGRQNVPEARFLAMDAVALGLASDSIDKMVCIEAAFHFDTRERFLLEARRVLKPGGQIVLSDILFRHWVHRRDRMVPLGNDVRGVDDYKRLYDRSGFVDVQVIDCTAQTVRSFHRYAVHWAWQQRRLRALLYFLGARLVLQQYLIVSARKPFPSERLGR